MIRTVSSVDLGLDVLLGGGFRLVKRLPDTESATVLVRGGAGAGKTLVGLHAALALARALRGDVVVACVEILPSEYVAQIRAARPDIEERRVAALPAALGPSPEPRVYCGLLTELDTDAPDLVAGLEALGRDVMDVGGTPSVFVVDSLIEGYGIGASVPRTAADAVMKFAAQSGSGVVLCEEVGGDGPSPWVFAADTVIELGVAARERGRWIEVRKNRFGASVSGRHELELGGGTAPAVFPEPHAWVAGDLRGVLRGHGWELGDRTALPVLAWDEALRPPPAANAFSPPLEGAFVAIVSTVPGVARSLSYALGPAGGGSDLLIELDPLVVRDEALGTNIHHVPTVHGPARALRMLVEHFGRSFTKTGVRRTAIRRVVIGDLEHVLAASDALAWVEAVRVFASLVIESRWSIPVIAYATNVQHLTADPCAALSAYADLNIATRAQSQAQVGTRWGRRSWFISWNNDVTALPTSIDQLPRAPGR